jgi:hypothetical protein
MEHTAQLQDPAYTKRPRSCEGMERVFRCYTRFATPFVYCGVLVPDIDYLVFLVAIPMGKLANRIGRKKVLACSLVGVLPGSRGF